MRIVVLGAPGAGKGTQAQIIARIKSITHISTGDIFRRNIKEQTELGRLAKEYMDRGELVPDEVTIKLVIDTLNKLDTGFILDGFPRTIAQADALEKELNRLGKPIDRVVNIKVCDEKILKRMSGRRSCTKCQASYHITYNPPKVEGKCDHCYSQLYQREDDKEETVKNRLKVYYAQTEPLIGYYSKKGLLSEVNGEEGTIDEITERILKAINS